MSYQSIKGAWRTRKQALSHILSELEGGRLGAGGEGIWAGCVYESTENGKTTHCGVGCLFNPAQIRSIKARGLNGAEIEDVSDVIGVKNIETVTGLEMDELTYLQEVHDSEYEVIRLIPKKTHLHWYLTRELAKAK